MNRLPVWLSQHLAALRVVLVLTLTTGLLYPLGMTALAHVPGLAAPAQGSDSRARTARWSAAA